MKTKIIILLLLALGQITGYAQNTPDEHLFGHVTNKASKEYIPFINITIKGTTIGTTADATGHYFLKNMSFWMFE